MIDKEKVLKVIEEIVNHGFKAYLVGGYVRNSLLNLPSTDVDVTTNATPKQLMEIFPQSLPMEDYGAVTVFRRGIRFEITTFRKEGEYINHRKPKEIKYIDDLYQDLLRRDFTVNTICMDKDGQIIDLLDAKKDLKSKIIRAVGNPMQKLNEDSLRILRAIRFATLLGFDLDGDTKQAIIENKKYLTDLSYERKKEELDKIFSSSNAYRGIQLMLELGLDKDLGLKKLNEVGPTNNSIGIWAVLDVTDKYPFSNNEKELIEAISQAIRADNLDSASLYYYGLYPNTVAAKIKGIDLKVLTEKYAALPIHSRKELNISSEDIMRILGREPGSYLKDVYEMIEIEILYNRLENDTDLIMEFIKSKCANVF